MKNGEIESYKKFISTRIENLLLLAGLEVEGFAQYLSISTSHMYAIQNGTRELTSDIANRMGAAFNISGANILRVSYGLPKNLKKSDDLNKFYDENKSVKSYFRNTRIERKDSYFVEREIKNSNLFDTPIYIWEIKEFFEAKGKKYDSKQLSQILNYMVIRQILKKKKKSIKLRNGKFGNRMVDVFYK